MARRVVGVLGPNSPSARLTSTDDSLAETVMRVKRLRMEERTRAEQLQALGHVTVALKDMLLLPAAPKLAVNAPLTAVIKCGPHWCVFKGSLWGGQWVFWGEFLGAHGIDTKFLGSMAVRQACLVKGVQSITRHDAFTVPTVLCLGQLNVHCGFHHHKTESRNKQRNTETLTPPQGGELSPSAAA